MWKRNTPEANNHVAEVTVSEPPNTSRADQALVGPSITIKGGLAGEEDVIIQGKVEGTVEFRKHNVTIGKHGRVNADIYAQQIVVEGTLKGDLYAETRVSIKANGSVSGNITSPRVVMEDGARFRGSVDMDKKPDAVNNHTDKLVSQPAFTGSKTVVNQNK